MKKYLAIFIVLALVFSLMSVTAFAATEEEQLAQYELDKAAALKEYEDAKAAAEAKFEEEKAAALKEHEDAEAAAEAKFEEEAAAKKAALEAENKAAEEAALEQYNNDKAAAEKAAEAKAQEEYDKARAAAEADYEISREIEYAQYLKDKGKADAIQEALEIAEAYAKFLKAEAESVSGQYAEYESEKAAKKAEAEAAYKLLEDAYAEYLKELEAYENWGDDVGNKPTSVDGKKVTYEGQGNESSFVNNMNKNLPAGVNDLTKNDVNSSGITFNFADDAIAGYFDIAIKIGDKNNDVYYYRVEIVPGGTTKVAANPGSGWGTDFTVTIGGAVDKPTAPKEIQAPEFNFSYDKFKPVFGKFTKGEFESKYQEFKSEFEYDDFDFDGIEYDAFKFTGKEFTEKFGFDPFEYGDFEYGKFEFGDFVFVPDKENKEVIIYVPPVYVPPVVEEVEEEADIVEVEEVLDVEEEEVPLADFEEDEEVDIEDEEVPLGDYEEEEELFEFDEMIPLAEMPHTGVEDMRLVYLIGLGLSLTGVAVSFVVMRKRREQV